VGTEVSLSHACKVVQNAAICYCIAIKTLINAPGVHLEAYNNARQWAKEHDKELNSVNSWF
jgi:hypothetical protein